MDVPRLQSQQPPDQAPPTGSGLRLTVLSGDGATNLIEKQQGAAPVVQVMDAQGDPLAGADVTFQAPVLGPSVTFFGANARVTMRTDTEGRAQAPNTLPNTYEGPFTINVSASYQGSTASADIHQTNLEKETPRKKNRWYKGWPIVGVAIIVTIAIVAVALKAGD